MTGPAGTGKTTLARNWRDHDPGFLLCATTGIAAVNLGDAVTVHSTLRFFDTASLEDSFINGFLQGRMRKLRASGVTRYGIDEVSMMPARVLTLLTQAVEELNSDAAAQMGHEPQIGITLIGDFLQLPPVKADYAFESPEWGKYEQHTVMLRDNYRQTDAHFVQALRAVRIGDADAALEYLRSYIQPQKDLNYPGVTILSKNQQVDRFNRLRHDALPGETITFKNTITGEPLKEWQKHIPISVGLKRGARVMILANKYLPSLGDDSQELIYANGDTGTFVDGNPTQKWAKVQLTRTGQIITVGYNIRQNLRPTGAKGKKKDRYEVLGEIDYMPLRLAYCTSTHKCVAATTRIPVRGRGLVEIRYIQPGEEIYTGTRWSRVLALKASERPAYRITTKRGYTVVASAEHRWPIDAGTWARTDELNQHTDLLLSARIPEDAGTSELSVDVAWWLGATLGDACVTDRREGQIHFTNQDAAMRDRWMEIAQQLGGRPNTRRDRRGCHLTSKPVRLQLELWGVDYVKSPAKSVPAAVWQAGPAAWRAFLQGLFDTDGSVRRSGVTFCTRSQRLGEEVQYLLLLLGVCSARGVYPGATGLYTHVHIATEMIDRYRAQVGFFRPTKAAACAKLKGTARIRRWFGRDTVKTVDPLRLTIPMYDLEVADTAHLVCFNGVIGSNSQGLTLDSVQVDISDPFFAAPAMTYVALSRARSLAGLRLVGNPELLRKRCTVDPKVERWR